MSKISLLCSVCGKTYLVDPYRKGTSKFCSFSCHGKYRYQFVKDRFNCIKRGAAHPMYGKKHTLETRMKISKNHADLSGDKNPRWRGDAVGYAGIHDWIVSVAGRPSSCSVCGARDAHKYHWANKDHKYRRNVEDWARVCVPCHKRMDGHYGPWWGKMIREKRWGVGA